MRTRLTEATDEAPGAAAAMVAEAVERGVNYFDVAPTYGDAEELAERVTKAVAALADPNPRTLRALRARGTFLDGGEPPKIAFLYTGQGSQYVNMLDEEKRVHEIARMLGGIQLTRKTLDHAREMVAQAAGH